MTTTTQKRHLWKYKSSGVQVIQIENAPGRYADDTTSTLIATAPDKLIGPGNTHYESARFELRWISPPNKVGRVKTHILKIDREQAAALAALLLHQQQET